MCRLPREAAEPQQRFAEQGTAAGKCPGPPGASPSVPGGIWDQSEREQMVPRDTRSHCRAAHAIPGFAGKKKKINDVFCNSARGGALAGGTERCPAIRAVPCPPLHLRVADKAAGRASVKGTYPGPDISPEKPHRSEKPGSSQRRTEGGGAA